MNRKGFTLIELLAVIVIIGLLLVLMVPGLLNNIDTAKQTSYNTLIRNVVTSSQLYYEECEYGDLSSTEKYGSYACSISGNAITTTLGTLANTGFLKVNDTKELADGTEIKIVLNPINDNDISDCTITIQKNIEEKVDDNGITNYKVTYEVISDIENCPTTDEYRGVE